MNTDPTTLPTETQVGLILAVFGKACGLIEASVLHDPENAESYKERLEGQILRIRNAHRWQNKLSADQMQAIEFTYADTVEGIATAEAFNGLMDLLELDA